MNVVLYQPQIPPNTGNIARLCVATQTTLHLIHPLGFKTDDATLKRAGLDYWKYLTIFHHENWEAFIRAYPEARMFFYSKKSEKPYSQVEYHPQDFLVFGAETTGLPDLIWQKYPEQFLTIPMWGPTRSINLGTSVGIVLYEALRQVSRGFEKMDNF